MSAAVPIAYDAVLYPSYTHPQTHPDALSTRAHLFGLDPAPPEQCRVLELGCGDGSNLLPMALTLPGSHFTGLDLAAAPIARAQADAAALGFKNTSFHALSVTELPPDFGEFDYIIAHGLYSWVPPHVRESIMALCRAHLAPRGVAYISYAVLPGCHLRAIVRDMMRFHTRAVAEPAERIHQAIAMLKFMAEAAPPTDAYHHFLREELASVLRRDENNLFHDELADENTPLHFHDFCAHARRHRLQYLGESDYVFMQEHSFTPEAVRLLSQLNHDRVRKEQYLDFLSGRRFRQTLLCREEHALHFPPAPALVAGLRVAGQLRPEPTGADLTSDAPVRFQGKEDSRITLAFPPAKVAMALLGEIWPEALPFPELRARLHARLGRPPPAPDAPLDADALALGGLLLQACAPGLVSLHRHPARYASRARERPVASPLIRHQLQRSRTVANLLHTRVLLEDDSGGALLKLLDGTRDRAALLRDLAATRPGASAEDAARQLDHSLALLARFALLTS